MTNWFDLGGILQMSVMQLVAYGVMTVLALKALSHRVGAWRLHRRFGNFSARIEAVKAADAEKGRSLSDSVGLDLGLAILRSRAAGSLVPVEATLQRIFDPVIDGCERGLFYCPSFGLFFTVTGGLLAILSAVGSGQFERNSMIEGIGIAMATTAAGFAIAMVEFWALQTTERLRDRLFADAAEALTVPAPGGSTHD